MEIYKQEIKDGIADLVQTSASIAYCMPASVARDTAVASSEVVDKIKASANPKQIDLYYITSVLVSTGWNKNDDVFNPLETWAARSTPEDKQFNFMHDENDIIGHITGSYIINEDGEKVVSEEMPSKFDIVTEAVLYNSWTSPENRERMSQIIAEIEEGKWFVSMECLFAGFDYALLNEAGEAKLLERNEGSAFLTKHLRAYGGTGEYEGYKIGRSLKEISFSGKGLVSKPANPRSVILDASRAFSLDDITITSFPKGDNDMSETNLLEQQLAELKEKLASAQEENKALRSQAEEAASKEVVESITKLEATIAEKDELIATLEASVAEKEASITELQDSIAKSEEDMKEKMEELKKMKKEKKMEARKAALLDLGLEAEEAEESVASYEELDDTSFETVLAAMKKMADKYKKEDVSEEEKPKAEEAEAEATEEAEAVSEEAVAEILEEVSTSEATLVDASDENDELLATRASVAEWLESNVLSK